MDPQNIPFPTIDKEYIISELFINLAIAIYAKPERKDKFLDNLHNAQIFSDFNIKFWTSDTLPATVQELVTLYLNQPITEKDRTGFLETFFVPFMGTDKTVKELYTINPAVFTPVLDALIHSKRIQRIISQPNTLKGILERFENLKKFLRDGALEELQIEAATLKPFLRKIYEEQEVIIASEFIQAQEKEKQLLVSEENMKAKIAANVHRRRRKSRRGGKRSTRKVSSLRRRR